MEIKVIHEVRLAPETLATLSAIFAGAGKLAVKPEQSNGLAKKPETVTAPKPEPVKTTEGTAVEVSQTDAPALSEKPKIKLQDIRALVAEKKDAGKSDGIRGLLAEFAVEGLTKLAADQYPAFYKKLTEL